MFWPDVVALKEFYSSVLGQMACLAIRKRIRAFWPNISNDTILGLGFTTPYLLPFVDKAQLTISCMPAAMGVIHWPSTGSNLSLLSDEAALPFADNSINRVIVTHAIENSELTRQMLTEIWRVLTPAGRLLVVIPNRRGIWVRSPSSPFAYGQPFTPWQFRQLLFEHSFTPLSNASALFFPPTMRRFILRWARVVEVLGARFFPAFGGVLIMEAEKQLYAPAGLKARNRGRKIYVPVMQPVPLTFNKMRWK